MVKNPLDPRYFYFSLLRTTSTMSVKSITPPNHSFPHTDSSGGSSYCTRDSTMNRLHETLRSRPSSVPVRFEVNWTRTFLHVLTPFVSSVHRKVRSPYLTCPSTSFLLCFTGQCYQFRSLPLWKLDQWSSAVFRPLFYCNVSVPLP